MICDGTIGCVSGKYGRIEVSPLFWYNALFGIFSTETLHSYSVVSLPN